MDNAHLPQRASGTGLANQARRLSPGPLSVLFGGKLEADRWAPGLSFGSPEEEASRQPLSALPEECQTLDPFPWFCFLHAFGFCFVFILKNIQFRVKGQD